MLGQYFGLFLCSKVHMTRDKTCSTLPRRSLLSIHTYTMTNGDEAAG